MKFSTSMFITRFHVKPGINKSFSNHIVLRPFSPTHSRSIFTKDEKFMEILWWRKFSVASFCLNNIANLDIILRPKAFSIKEAWKLEMMFHSLLRFLMHFNSLVFLISCLRLEKALPATFCLTQISVQFNRTLSSASSCERVNSRILINSKLFIFVLSLEFSQSSRLTEQNCQFYGS